MRLKLQRPRFRKLSDQPLPPWLSRDFLRQRLVFWVGAGTIGLVSVFFAFAADQAQTLFQYMAGQGIWVPLILSPLGFMLCAYLARTVFPGAAGSGIQQAIAACETTDIAARSKLLSLRVAIGKIFLTLVGIASGGSIGREGPTVQIGAAIMLKVGEIGGADRAKGLILAGSAAGISAAFNAPLAGIVFAIEEMSRSFEQKTSGLVLSAVIIAGLVSLGLVGNYDYFGQVSGSVKGVDGWVMVVLCGVFGGLAGALFGQLMLRLTQQIRVWTSVMPWKRTLAVAGACGLAVALIGIATGGSTFGTGYEHARAAIEGEVLPWYFAPAKFASTLLSSISGIPGGIFAPSLAVGTGVGSLLVLVMGGSAGVAALLGMAGYFAGVVQAPITAFVIILEMTGDSADLIPIMCASVIGYGVSSLLVPQSLYHGLAESLIPQPKPTVG
ncbi:chloride channel protein [Kaistia sp. 32K]|uniref:chloride channel protein n=1 Tax=Kaistia sp. 32K TaxID=2795690 RepID=UPI00353027FF